MRVDLKIYLKIDLKINSSRKNIKLNLKIINNIMVFLISLETELFSSFLINNNFNLIVGIIANMARIDETTVFIQEMRVSDIWVSGD